MTEHKHHWKLPTPDGPTAPGVCKVCGTTREFYNTAEAAEAAGKRVYTRKGSIQAMFSRKGDWY